MSAQWDTTSEAYANSSGTKLDNTERKFSTVKDWQTPTSHFFVRNHFDIPMLDVSRWRLRIDGAVNRSLELTLTDLQARTAANFPATLACAQYDTALDQLPNLADSVHVAAIGNAFWQGVLLRTLLEEAGIRPSGVEVVLFGADRGWVAGPPELPLDETITYAWSLPVQKAMADETILAYAMNGEALTPAHGFPLRAVVATWYGMASVKWLTRIHVLEQPFTGYWQMFKYMRWDRQLGEARLEPLRAMPVKSQLIQPASGAILLADQPVRIYGAAWGGSWPIVSVEVSTDGGKNWRDARLLEPASPYSWQFWDYHWTPSQPGCTILFSRATDSAGNSQPAFYYSDDDAEPLNWTVPVEVEIRTCPDHAQSIRD